MKGEAPCPNIVFVSIELFIHHAQSLKDKRSAVRGLTDQLRSRFNASVAEYGFQDKWQRAMIGVCMLSGDRRKLESDTARLRQFCEENARMEIIDIRQDWI